MSDLISLFTSAKDAGFEFGSMIMLGGIYLRVESLAKKRHKETLAAADKRHEELRVENNSRWDKLIATLQGHDDKNEKRFSNIETHIGLNKR